MTSLRELRTLTLQQVVTAALLEGVGPEAFAEAQRALDAYIKGRGRATAPSRVLVNAIRAKRQPRRCDSAARKGTGEGVCDTPLDDHGNCPNAAQHVER